MDTQTNNTNPENEIQQTNNSSKILKYYEYFVFIYFLIGVFCLVFDEYFIKIEIINSLYIMGSIAYVGSLIYVCISYLIIGCIIDKHKYAILNFIDTFSCIGAMMPILYSFFSPLVGMYTDSFKEKTYVYYIVGGFFSLIPLLFCYIDNEKIELRHILKVLTRILIIVFIVLFMLGACDIDVSVNLN